MFPTRALCFQLYFLYTSVTLSVCFPYTSLYLPYAFPILSTCRNSRQANPHGKLSTPNTPPPSPLSPLRKGQVLHHSGQVSDANEFFTRSLESCPRRRFPYVRDEVIRVTGATPPQSPDAEAPTPALTPLNPALEPLLSQ